MTPRRVAFNIAPLTHRNGDLQKRGGIHHAMDAWLAALRDATNKSGAWDIRAFAPLGIEKRLRAQAAKGAFVWWPAAADTQQNAPPFLDTAGFRHGPPVSPLLSSVWAQEGLFQARRHAARYDLMHVLAPSYLPLPKFAPKRCVATIWDMTVRTHSETHTPDNIAAWETYFAWAENDASRIVTISQAAKAEIVHHLEVEPGRVGVVSLAPRAGVGLVSAGPERDAFLQSVGLVPGTPFVLYAGTLEPRKNVARLIAAFAQVVRDLPRSPVVLVLAGGTWANYDTILKEAAEAEGIESRVRFCGYVPGDVMNALMSACAVFAYPSLGEGFGMPPLEAMACGAPVVTSNLSSLPEVVGEAGVQVDPTDKSAIAHALHTLLTNEAENARRRDLSRARAALFSWGETARQTIALYDDVLSGGTGTVAVE